MQHSDFVIGELFQCTDIRTRTIVAIRVDSVMVEHIFDENGIKGCESDGA